MRTDPGGKKSAKIMENFHENHTINFFKTIKLMFTDINIYPINNKTDHISEKYWYFPDFRSDLEQDPDPLFHETDPRIRIHIKMKRIRNTGIDINSAKGYCKVIFLHLRIFCWSELLLVKKISKKFHFIFERLIK